MAYVIDKQLCSGCDACSIVCPTNAISHDAKAEKNSIDAEYCVSCRLCSSFCDKNAIKAPDGSFSPYKGWENWSMPFIDPDKCSGCSLCIEECPMNAIGLTGPAKHGDIHTYAYLKDSECCIGCEKCCVRCPIGAITMIPQLDPDGRENPANLWPEYIEKPEKRSGPAALFRNAK